MDWCGSITRSKFRFLHFREFGFWPWFYKRSVKDIRRSQWFRWLDIGGDPPHRARLSGLSHSSVDRYWGFYFYSGLAKIFMNLVSFLLLRANVDWNRAGNYFDLFAKINTVLKNNVCHLQAIRFENEKNLLLGKRMFRNSGFALVFFSRFQTLKATIFYFSLELRLL